MAHPDDAGPAELEAFERLFAAGRYWEAHEALEGPWRESRSELLHGLILAASAWVHVQRGNRRGAAAQARKAEAALAGLGARRTGLDLDGLRERLRALRQAAERGRALPDAPPLRAP